MGRGTCGSAARRAGRCCRTRRDSRGARGREGRKSGTSSLCSRMWLSGGSESRRRRRTRRRRVPGCLHVSPGAQLLSLSALLLHSVTAAWSRPQHPKHRRQVCPGPGRTLRQGRAHRSVSCLCPSCFSTQLVRFGSVARRRFCVNVTEPKLSDSGVLVTNRAFAQTERASEAERFVQCDPQLGEQLTRTGTTIGNYHKEQRARSPPHNRNCKCF